MALLSLYRRGHRRTLLWVLLASPAAACDGGAASLVREIDAAREGCTEEMLKASDEVCVRMFEKYADMAADGMETYIGGMRAFDEAVQRQGNLQFDTAGLGNALGERWRAGTDQVAPEATLLNRDGTGPFEGRVEADGRSFAPAPEYVGGGYGPVAGGRWSDADPTVSLPPPAPGPAFVPDAASAGAGRSVPARRGALLPPEERLRRPWIDDADNPAPYVEEAPPRRDVLPDPQQAVPGGGRNPAPGGWGGTWDAY